MKGGGKLAQKRNGNGKPIVNTPIPTLDDTCRQLEDMFLGVMSGSIPLDKARAGLGIKKQQMKRFDYAIQFMRMNPSVRPSMAQFLGLPEPPTPATAV